MYKVLDLICKNKCWGDIYAKLNVVL